jgi:hypothetical protein
VPLGGAPVNVNVVPLKVYAELGSCLTLPTNTSMSKVDEGATSKVNAVVLCYLQVAPTFRQQVSVH